MHWYRTDLVSTADRKEWHRLFLCESCHRKVEQVVPAPPPNSDKSRPFYAGGRLAGARLSAGPGRIAPPGQPAG